MAGYQVRQVVNVGVSRFTVPALFFHHLNGHQIRLIFD